MNLKIKQTTGLTLNGNKLSGNTYPVKDYIKAHLGGKWDGNNKCWIVDVEKVNDLIEHGGYLSIDDSPAPVVKSTTTNLNGSAHWNGWCNKCHSYCWGDCEAN